MTEFSTAAMLEVELDQQSVRSARGELETMLPDPEVSADGGRRGGGNTGSVATGVGTGALTSSLSDSVGEGFDTLLEFARERNELLDDIKDEIEKSARGGGGGLLGAGLGARAAGGAASTLLKILAAGTLVKATQEGAARVDPRAGEIQDERVEAFITGDLGEKIWASLKGALDPTGLGQSFAESMFEGLVDVGGEVKSRLESLEWPSLPSLGSLEWPSLPSLGSLEWPDLPAFEWPSLPELPDFELQIPEPPQWVQQLLEVSNIDIKNPMQNGTGANNRGRGGSQAQSGSVTGRGASSGGATNTPEENRATTRRQQVNATFNVDASGAKDARNVRKRVERQLDELERRLSEIENAGVGRGGR